MPGALWMSRALACVMVALAGLVSHAVSAQSPPIPSDIIVDQEGQASGPELARVLVARMEQVIGVPLWQASPAELETALLVIESAIGLGSLDHALVRALALQPYLASDRARKSAMDAATIEVLLATALRSTGTASSADAIRTALGLAHSADAGNHLAAELKDRIDQSRVVFDHAGSYLPEMRRGYQPSDHDLELWEGPDIWARFYNSYGLDVALAKATDLAEADPTLILSMIYVLTDGNADALGDEELVARLASLQSERPPVPRSMIAAMAGALLVVRPGIADKLERLGLAARELEDVADGIRASLVSNRYRVPAAERPGALIGKILSLDIETLRARFLAALEARNRAEAAARDGTPEDFLVEFLNLDLETEASSS